MSPAEFASRILAYCLATGASVTSWGRTANHNRKVGGVSLSYHLVWLAADVVYDLEVAEAFKSKMASHLGLKIIFDNGYDHLQAKL